MDDDSQRTGRALPGGGVGGAIRVGGTVHRPTGPWSPGVHLLLRHLEHRGLDGVPRAYGFDTRDGQRVEVLSYLDGDCPEAYDPWPAWAYSEDLVGQVAAWTRRFHDAVRDFRPDGLPWRSGVSDLAPDEIICHHDIAPYNVIVHTPPGATTAGRDGIRLAGVIDWDMAGPGRPVQDLAHLAWNFLSPAVESMPPDAAVAAIAERLELVAERYGDVEPVDLLTAIGPRMRRSARVIRAGADAGDPGLGNLVRSGRLADLEQKVRWWGSIEERVRERL